MCSLYALAAGQTQKEVAVREGRRRGRGRYGKCYYMKHEKPWSIRPGAQAALSAGATIALAWISAIANLAPGVTQNARQTQRWEKGGLVVRRTRKPGSMQERTLGIGRSSGFAASSKTSGLEGEPAAF